MRLADAIKLYERYNRYELKGPTRVRYRNDLRILCLSLRNPLVHQIYKEHILEDIDTMAALGWSPKSLHQKLSAYRQFFRFLKKHSHSSLDPDLIPKVQVDFIEPRVATEEEYAKILQAIPQKGMFNIRNRAMIQLLWDTGVRNGELISFNMNDLPKASGHSGVYSMLIKTEKSRGKRPVRDIFWSVETHRALLDWLEVRKEYTKSHEIVDPDAVFIALNTGHGRRLTVQAPEMMLTNYSKKAGLKTVNPHSFRHAKARRIIEMGGTNSDVMNILGHSSLFSSQIYTTLYDKSLETRAQKFL